MFVKTTHVIAAVVLVLSQCAASAAQDDTVRAIQLLEEELNSAFNRFDAITLDRLWAEELSFVSPNGAVANKAERMAGLKSPPPNIPVSTNESVVVKRYGDVAVAIVVSKWSVVNDGKPSSTYFRATHVWAKRAGGWKLVAAHVSQTKG
jgi:ketosteroid isomerase-like protein